MILDPDDWMAQQADNKESFDALMVKAGEMDAEEWGDFTGQILFEVGLEVATAGGAAALTTIKAADRTVDVARAINKFENVVDAERALNKVDNVGDGVRALEKGLGEVPEKLGPVTNKVDNMGPGSPAHKSQRWEDYQNRGGEWDYDRWSKTYDNNMQRARKANEAVDKYHETLGWGKREVTVDVNGDARRLDIADIADKRGVEMKSGEYFSRTEDIMSEISRDKQLVQDGWQIDWVIEGKASQPLIDELNSAGINVILK